MTADLKHHGYNVEELEVNRRTQQVLVIEADKTQWLISFEDLNSMRSPDNPA